MLAIQEQFNNSGISIYSPPKFFLTRLITKIFNPTEKRLIKIAKSCQEALDQLEATQSIENVSDWAALARTIEKALQTHFSSKKARRAKLALCVRRLSLLYRHDIKQPVENSSVEKVAELANNWRQSRPLYKTCKISEEYQEIFERLWNEKITRISRFTKFTKLLESDKEICDDFFKWSLRDNNAPEAYIQFFNTCQKIKRCYLSGRLGRFGDQLLKVEMRNGRKDLTLPFEGNCQSILDETREVTLQNNWTVTLDEIFSAFGRKNRGVEKFEVFGGGQGICNWSVFEHGPWNPEAQSYDQIDLEQDRWWEQYPCLDEISKESLQIQYPDLELNPGNWVLLASATRQSPTMDVDKSHGYFRVLIPTESGETYRVYDWGKFAIVFPVSVSELLSVLAITLPAKIAYPDENGFHGQRQHSHKPKEISADIGQEVVMNKIKHYIQKARVGTLYFQTGWKNCAYPFQRIFEKVHQTLDIDQINLYRVSIYESTPLNLFLKTVQKIAFLLPRLLGRLFINGLFKILELFFNLFGSYETFHGKSLLKTPFSDKQEFYHPAYLHKQIEDKKINGTITFSHLTLR